MPTAEEILNTKKIVVIGDGACGKTSLLMVYVNNEFPHEYVPTVFDNYHKDIIVDNNDNTTIVSALLMDTSGQEDYERLRSLQYYNVDIFIICFSIDSRTSFNNVRSIWMREIKSFNLPFILVATKLDLRDKTNNCIKSVEGEKLARKIKASAYIECSAKDNIGVGDVFLAAAKSSLQPRKHSKKCCLL